MATSGGGTDDSTSSGRRRETGTSPVVEVWDAVSASCSHGDWAMAWESFWILGRERSEERELFVFLGSWETRKKKNRNERVLILKYESVNYYAIFNIWFWAWIDIDCANSFLFTILLWLSYLIILGLCLSQISSCKYYKINRWSLLFDKVDSCLTVGSFDYSMTSIYFIYII